MDADDLGLIGPVTSEIREWIEMIAEGMEVEFTLLTPEYDAAIIGYTLCFEPNTVRHRVVYDYQKLIEIITEESDGGTWDEAVEYFDFNILGAYCGENMPSFLNRPEVDDV